MPTPCSGEITMLDIRSELGQSGQIALNDANVRTLCNKPSGQIALSDCYCKSYIHWVNIVNPMASLNYNNAVFGSDAYQKVGNETSIKTYYRWDQLGNTVSNSHYQYYDGNDSTYIQADSVSRTRILMIHGRRITATSDLKIKNIRVRSWHQLYNNSSGSVVPMSMNVSYKILYSNHNNPGIDMGITWNGGTSPSSPGNCVFHNHPVITHVHNGDQVSPGQNRTYFYDDTTDIYTNQTIMTAGQTRWVFVAISYDPSPWTFVRWLSPMREYEVDLEIEGGYAV